MVVGAGLGAKHQLPQDDSEAEDVCLRRPGTKLQVLPEQLRCRPEELWVDGRWRSDTAAHHPDSCCRCRRLSPLCAASSRERLVLLPRLNSHRPKPESLTCSRLSTRQELSFKFPWNFRLLLWMNSIP